jgi:hypothetical protein
MLLPDISVKISWKALGMILYPFILGIGLFIQQMVTWSGTDDQSFLGFAIIFGLLLSKGYKSVTIWLRTQKNYRATLVRSLYHNQLDVNKGVVTQLHSEAERQIMREAVLAYTFLWMKVLLPPR